MWGWFKALSNRRVKPNPITYSELRAWGVMTGARPTAAEVSLLMRLDDMFRQIVWKA